MLQPSSLQWAAAVYGPPLRVSGLGFRVSGLGFRVWGLGFKGALQGLLNAFIIFHSPCTALRLDVHTCVCIYVGTINVGRHYQIMYVHIYIYNLILMSN